jgi:hypothetical protein
MRLVVMTEERLADCRQFGTTGLLPDGRGPSDSWIQESLGMCSGEIDSLRDRLHVHWEALDSCQRISGVARAAHKAWKAGEDLEPSMTALGRALRGAS